MLCLVSLIFLRQHRIRPDPAKIEFDAFFSYDLPMSMKLEFWKDVGACAVALAEAFTPIAGFQGPQTALPQQAAITAIAANPHDIWAAKASGMERERRMEEARTSVFTMTYASMALNGQPLSHDKDRRRKYVTNTGLVLSYG